MGQENLIQNGLRKKRIFLAHVTKVLELGLAQHAWFRAQWGDESPFLGFGCFFLFLLLTVFCRLFSHVCELASSNCLRNVYPDSSLVEKSEHSCPHFAGSLLGFSLWPGQSGHVSSVYRWLSAGIGGPWCHVDGSPQRSVDGKFQRRQADAGGGGDPHKRHHVCSGGAKLGYKGMVVRMLEFGLIHKIDCRLCNFP